MNLNVSMNIHMTMNINIYILLYKIIFSINMGELWMAIPQNLGQVITNTLNSAQDSQRDFKGGLPADPVIEIHFQLGLL